MFNNRLFPAPVNEGAGCICHREHIGKKDYKTVKKRKKKKKITPPEHMVSVLQAPPLLLLSTGSVVLSALSIQAPFGGSPQRSANTAWSNSSPYCTRRGSLFIFPFFFPCLPACLIRYEELTHNPFIQTQIEQECIYNNDIK